MDSIGDMLARMNNAIRVRKETVDLPHSRVKEAIAQIMLSEGYIGRCESFARMNKKFLRIGLKYTGEKRSVIRGMKRISKPGRRIYVGVQSLPRVQAGFGTAILSTSRGLMTDEGAREKKLGGEVICYIW